MGKRMWCGLVAAMVIVAAAPAEAAAGEKLWRDVATVQALGVTGVVAAVTKDGRTTRARAGVGDVRTGRPVPFEGRFRAGSVTKTFVSAVLLQLVGEGRLALEDTVDRWLPGVVTGNGNDGKKVTVRQLLQHTSGVPGYQGIFPAIAAEFDEWRFESYRPRDLVAAAMTQPPEFPPGQGWGYSNTNYILAGMIVERLTGRSWAVEVRDRVVRPLGLHGTSAPGTLPVILGPHVRGYEHHPDGSLLDVTVMNPSRYDAAAALITTIDDLGRFATALLDGTLLRPAQRAELLRLDPIGGYGLGIGRLTASCGTEYWSSNGMVFGYVTQFAVTDDGRRGVAVSASTMGFLPTTWKPGPALASVQNLIDNALCD